MSYKKKILASSYPLIKWTNKILTALGLRPKGRLRVIIYHDIPVHLENEFSNQLSWLSKSWKFVTPEAFSRMMAGQEKILEDSLLLTFDDGFISNRRVAETVLENLGISALFFVVTDFINLSSTQDWRKFVGDHIVPGLNPNMVSEDQRNMSWEDLAFLVERGHSIGAHTADHSRLCNVEYDNLQNQIIASADEIEEKLSLKVEHFAYTFGDLKSFSADGLKIARQRFNFIYTGIRGYNNNVAPWAIRRDAVSPTESCLLVGAFLEGAGDWLYSADLKVYDTWSSRT